MNWIRISKVSTAIATKIVTTEPECFTPHLSASQTASTKSSMITRKSTARNSDVVREVGDQAQQVHHGVDECRHHEIVDVERHGQVREVVKVVAHFTGDGLTLRRRLGPGPEGQCEGARRACPAGSASATPPLSLLLVGVVIGRWCTGSWGPAYSEHRVPELVGVAVVAMY